MNKMTKSVNEHFFDKKSKEMYYVLGLVYGSYAPPFHYQDFVLFRESNEHLINIIRHQLQSDHNIIPDNRGKSSYFFAFRSPYMRSRLEEIGLTQDKSKRSFPEDIKDEYLDHFIRGFSDEQGHIEKQPYNPSLIRIGFYFYKSFLEKLKEVLNNCLGLKGSEINDGGGRQSSLSYGYYSSLRLYEFIYRDFEYIQKHNLYLPRKKDLFNLNGDPERSQIGFRNNLHRKKTIEKIEMAKKLLIEGNKVKDVVAILNYSGYSGFDSIFKSIVGMSPREFVNSSKQQINL